MSMHIPLRLLCALLYLRPLVIPQRLLDADPLTHGPHAAQHVSVLPHDVEVPILGHCTQREALAADGQGAVR